MRSGLTADAPAAKSLRGHGVVTTDTKVLPYQNARTLDDVPQYIAGLQVRLSGGERVYIALSALELALYFERGPALHYDLEGRLTKIAEHDHYRRRGLSHSVLFTRKRTVEEGGGIERMLLSTEEADALVVEAQKKTALVFQELKAGVGCVGVRQARSGPSVETDHPAPGARG